ncbi:hypothetical protein F4813DRAFT_178355 [Daldinia decipiens]|uniref:uncharacterized protein n=1 Tax=Daldinia decipiens TaxID=326647 RepID=UPI0020C4CFE5|nr:uncharacterized protein F4813DRAFT_178355 [Daldinia decipiens]KAI1655293.1 hypothetical protein F4813DRAFT_178355 [Daldinia decipiens]
MGPSAYISLPPLPGLARWLHLDDFSYVLWKPIDNRNGFFSLGFSFSLLCIILLLPALPPSRLRFASPGKETKRELEVALLVRWIGQTLVSRFWIRGFLLSVVVYNIFIGDLTPQGTTNSCHPLHSPGFVY